MSSDGPKAPTVQSTMPKTQEGKPAKSPTNDWAWPDTTPKLSSPPATPKTPRDGTRPKENPGAVVYDSGKKFSTMIRASRIFSEAWRRKTQG